MHALDRLRDGNGLLHLRLAVDGAGKRHETVLGRHADVAGLDPSVVASSVLTFVVIHVSVTGCSEDFALMSALAAYAPPTPPHASAIPNAIALN